MGSQLSWFLSQLKFDSLFSLPILLGKFWNTRGEEEECYCIPNADNLPMVRVYHQNLYLYSCQSINNNTFEMTEVVKAVDQGWLDARSRIIKSI